MRKVILLAFLAGVLLGGCGRTITAPERCVRWQSVPVVDSLATVDVGVVVPCEASRGR